MEPSAFSMNLFKHHGLFLKSQVQTWARSRSFPGRQLLRKIGNSQMDLYLGNLTPDQIFQELSVQLEQRNIHVRNDFIHWISPKDYKILNCSDDSQWILRLKKEEPGPFIHLHPARYSPFSIRIKAGTFKTTLLAATYYSIYQQLPDHATLNQLRVDKLDLSPTQNASWHQKVLSFLI